MKSVKPRVLLFGNCQGGWLAKSLLQKSELTSEFELIYIHSNPKSPLEDKISDPDYIRTCSHVLWQTAAGCKPPPFVASLPKEVKQVRFPTLCLKWLWPFHVIDPARHIKEPGFPDGRFSYGDRLLMKLLEEGVSADNLPQRYQDTDLSKIINLDRYREMAVAELKFNDKQSDIAAASLIDETFRQHQSFAAVNHPNPVILEQVALKLASAILERSVTPIPAESGDMGDILGHQEIPVHPSIVTHFKLEWVKPGMKWRYGAEQLSLNEYVKAYGSCRAIPYQENPKLWLDRAIGAVGRKDLKEAERLFLKGASLYPAFTHFLRGLSMLYLQQNRLIDAEKVCRYALQLHANQAPLHADLANVLLRRKFPNEAKESFREALRLDPGYRQALEFFRCRTASTKAAVPT